MNFDISNKVLEDLVICLMEGHLDKKCIITDKVDHITKRDGQPVYPLVFKEESLYVGISKKIAHYMNNLYKYEAIGITNVEQYALLVNLRRNKLYGKEKRIALNIQDYIKNRAEYLKMGFQDIEDFLIYKEYFHKTKDYKDAAYLYSTDKEFYSRKSYYEKKGVYSLEDYRLFSSLMEKSIRAYTEEKLHNKITFVEYLDFELREFKWKKEYFERKKTLKGVGAYIRKRYLSNSSAIVVEEHPYFLEPGYHYKQAGVRTFGELYEYYEKMINFRHRYRSEKIEDDYLNYMLENIRGGKK